ncbi:MAG TPA: response regulator, partial [Spirochaetia bacterium]|nr:response regulator [Spirochaetales bacterium]HRW25386.1 response regulator [Spirochaetia bacterium]
MRQKARTTILVVENDALSALNARETLEAAGYATLSTGTGEGAARLVAESSVDLVLMDIRLDGRLDGIEAAATILRSYPLPIVFMSSHDDQATMSRLARVDAYGFIPKPFSNAVLLAAVSMAIRRAAAERTAAQRLAAEYERRLERSDTRLRESHHRIRNDIAAISSILSLQLGEAEHPETIVA